MSVSNGLQEIKSTYNLNQHKHGRNVSLQWVARNQIHALPEPAQAQQECQSPMGCKKPNPRTSLSSTRTARMSVSKCVARNRIPVLPGKIQAQQECQSPMGCK